MTAQAKKILIIEDDAASAKVVAKALSVSGFTCHVELTGLNAVEAVRTFQPDIVLLDKIMPKMNGQEVLQALRQEKSALELPIIMLTGQDHLDDLVESLSAGANDYITKPFNLPAALARINTQLQIVHLYRENLKSRELFAINAMIVTYNHEINNPLAVAIADVGILEAKHKSINFTRLKTSLERIRQIVQKIREAATKAPEYENYADDSTKMLKLP